MGGLAGLPGQGGIQGRGSEGPAQGAYGPLGSCRAPPRMAAGPWSPGVGPGGGWQEGFLFQFLGSGSREGFKWQKEVCIR